MADKEPIVFCDVVLSDELREEYRRRFPPIDADTSARVAFAAQRAYRLLVQAERARGAQAQRPVAHARQAFAELAAYFDRERERMAWLLTAGGHPTTVDDLLEREPITIDQKASLDAAFARIERVEARFRS